MNPTDETPNPIDAALEGGAPDSSDDVIALATTIRGAPDSSAVLHVWRPAGSGARVKRSSYTEST